MDEDGIVVRTATPADLPAVARLRWEMDVENGVDPAMGREEFLDAFADWASEHRHTHSCIIAARGEDVIGMAWLAVLPRVPSVRAFERASGDVQCVHVRPADRNAGVGHAILQELVALAERTGLEQVTTGSTERAVAAYERVGFERSPLVLRRRSLEREIVSRADSSGGAGPR
jgi:ribosomal protein S18 acetylase RimI-like enzyme